MEKECCVCFTESGIKLNRVLHRSMSIERELIENIDSDIESIEEKKDGPDHEGSPDWPVIVDDDKHVKASYYTEKEQNGQVIKCYVMMMFQERNCGK